MEEWSRWPRSRAPDPRPAVASSGRASPRPARRVGDPRQLLHAMAPRRRRRARLHDDARSARSGTATAWVPSETLATKWARPFKVYLQAADRPAPRAGDPLRATAGTATSSRSALRAWPVNLRAQPESARRPRDGRRTSTPSTRARWSTSSASCSTTSAARTSAARRSAEDRGRETILGRDCHRVRIFTTRSP